MKTVLVRSGGLKNLRRRGLVWFELLSLILSLAGSAAADDWDRDGVPDSEEIDRFLDLDGDGLVNVMDSDSDGDFYPDRLRP